MRVIRFLDRLVLIAFAIVLAAGAALVVGIAGLFQHDFGQSFANVAGGLGLTALAGLMTDGRVDDISTMLHQILVAVSVIWLAPIGLVALTGELFGKASWLFYVAGMAVLCCLIALVSGLSLMAITAMSSLMIGLGAMGVTAGTVYWLVAGRGAARKGTGL